MAVVITGTSGSEAHGGSLVITGSGFGTKSPVAPLVWDNCMHGQAVSARWSGGWPTSATYRPEYRTIQRSQPMPHNRTTRYLCMCAYGSGSATDGWNALVWKTLTIAKPQPIFMSVRHRCDSGFISGDNWKYMDYSNGNEPFGLSWYIEKSGGIPSAGPTDINLNDNAAGLNAHGDSANVWGDWYGEDGLGTGKAVSPRGTWVQQEFLVVATAADNGVIRQWDNNVLCLDYSPTNPKYRTQPHPTDAMAGSTRAFALGGYIRDGNSTAWRYFTDIYLDMTQSRVVLGNAPALAACTVKEMQIPTAWSTTSVTLTVNRGSFSDGATVYAYLYDSAGLVNAIGFPVNGSGDATPPAPPSNLRIL